MTAILMESLMASLHLEYVPFRFLQRVQSLAVNRECIPTISK